MTSQPKHIPDKVRSPWHATTQRLSLHFPGKGFIVLVFVIIALSALSSSDFSTEKPIVVAGEIAPVDITADRSFLFEDTKATQAKIEQTRQIQPLVCDLTLTPLDILHKQIQELIISINNAESFAEKEAVRQTLSHELGEEIPISMVNAMNTEEVQEIITQQLLPYVQQRLALGVLQDMRSVLPYKNGIIIRNLATTEESLHPDTQALSDLKSFQAQLSQKIKSLNLPAQGKRSLGQLFAGLVRPTLIPNYEATTTRAAAVEEALEPVLLRIQKGELLARQGEKISQEQHLKIQTLWNQKAEPFHISLFIGSSLCGLLLACGLLFSPSGKPASPMSNRDHIFISLLLIIFSLIAKGLSSLGTQLSITSITFSSESLAFGVPIAGAAALAALIFSTRRYLVTGILLAFFCTTMSKGGLGLFLYYFLSAMWSTWLTARTQTRQEVVWSVLPLILGLYFMWAGATCLQGGAHTRFFAESMAVATGAIFSMLLTFALAPVVEMVFGYTTRFRLMELLNLEQPILRELMLNAPGTYHHSLIVSNMVEAGAKAIGAHSLLCKVAALYHDIGKISKSGYFIENQLTDDNPHNKLTPSMSALILIAHTKQGAELGRQHRLGTEVSDIIRQHHGRGVIRYFYQKALQQTDTIPPKIEDFCYPGPKPQSKEAAIVLLADAVEASSRTLTDPTPHRLKLHIDGIMRDIHSEGQLDESEITFRDIGKLSESFLRILLGIFHHRIPYPDKKSKAVAR